jgi:hypothetical protein
MNRFRANTLSEKGLPTTLEQHGSTGHVHAHPVSSAPEQVPEPEVPATERGSTAQVPEPEVPATERGSTAQVPEHEVPATEHGSTAQVLEHEVPAIEHGSTAQVPEHEVPTTEPASVGQVPEHEVPATESASVGQVPEHEVPTTEPASVGQVLEHEVPAIEHGSTAQVPEPEMPATAQPGSTASIGEKMINLLTREPNVFGTVLKNISRHDRTQLRLTCKALAQHLDASTVVYSSKTGALYNGAGRRLDRKGICQAETVLFRWEGGGIFPDEETNAPPNAFHVHGLRLMLVAGISARLIEIANVPCLSLDWIYLTRFKDFCNLQRLRIFFCYPWTLEKTRILNTLNGSTMDLVVGKDTRFDIDMYPWDGRLSRVFDTVGSCGSLGHLEKTFPYLQRNSPQLLEQGTLTSLWLLHMATIEPVSLDRIPTDRVRLTGDGKEAAKLLEEHRFSSALPMPLIAPKLKRGGRDPSSNDWKIYHCDTCEKNLHGFSFPLSVIHGKKRVKTQIECGACTQDAKTRAAIFTTFSCPKEKLFESLTMQSVYLIRIQRTFYGNLRDGERRAQVTQQYGFDDFALNKQPSDDTDDDDEDDENSVIIRPPLPKYPKERRTWSLQQCPSLRDALEQALLKGQLPRINPCSLRPWNPPATYDNIDTELQRRRIITSDHNVPKIFPPIHIAHIVARGFDNIPPKLQPSSEAEPRNNLAQTKKSPLVASFFDDSDSD